MHICIIADNYPSKGRPVYVFIQQLVNQIVDMGHRVSIIAPQSLTNCFFRHYPILKYKTSYKTEHDNQYDVYRPNYISAGNASSIIRNIVYKWRQNAILSTLKKIDCDVVYGHFWGNVKPVSSYCKKHNLPLFVACGEGDNALEAMVASMTKEQIAQLNNCISGMISVSSENKRKCIDFGLISEERVIVLPNCVNTEVFRPMRNFTLRHELGLKDNDFVISFVGSFNKRKGARRVSMAVDMIQDGSIKTIFIGGHNGGEEIPTGSSIIFKGLVEHNDIPKYLNASDIFVLPTLKEGCSNAIVEALASGLPIISSNGAFNDDILNSHNSIRIDPENIEELASAILKMKTDKVFYSNCKDYIIEHISEHSIATRAKRILCFINEKL